MVVEGCRMRGGAAVARVFAATVAIALTVATGGAPAVAAPVTALGPFTPAHALVATAAQGGLSITVTQPSVTINVPINTGTASVSTQLGVVRVADARIVRGLWTASVRSTDFVAGPASSQVIDNMAIVYSAGTVTADGVVIVPIPGDLDATHTAVTSPLLLGARNASWNPTITVTVGNRPPAGTYVATITHSVA